MFKLITAMFYWLKMGFLSCQLSIHLPNTLEHVSDMLWIYLLSRGQFSTDFINFMVFS